MNFSRAKSYLIVIFIIVNLFLIYHLVSMTKSDTISAQTVENTISILSKKEIKVNKELIKTTPDSLFYLNLENPLADKDAFINSLKGKVNITKEGFEFVPENKKTEFKYLLPSYDAARQALAHLKDCGFSGKYLECIGTLDMGKGVYKASFIQSFEGYDIYNTSIDIFYKEGEVLSASGIYYNIDSFSAPEESIRTQPEILIRFSGDINEKCIVKSIESGYFTQPYENEYSMISALPCYKITTDNGNKYYYDAVLSTLLKIDEF